MKISIIHSLIKKGIGGSFLGNFFLGFWGDTLPNFLEEENSKGFEEILAWKRDFSLLKVKWLYLGGVSWASSL